MKKYTSDRIDTVFDDLSDDLWVFKVIKRRKELDDLWQGYDDQKMKRLKVNLDIDRSDHLIFSCRSSAALNYVRSRKASLTDHFESFIKSWHIKGVIIKL